jgi:hypothetical protein
VVAMYGRLIDTGAVVKIARPLIRDRRISSCPAHRLRPWLLMRQD